MGHSKTLNTLNRLIGEIEAIGTHTHISSSHMAARGLHDIMLYHMVVSDLYDAGCQKDIAQQVLDGGGQYVLAVKANQETLHQSPIGG